MVGFISLKLAFDLSKNGIVSLKMVFDLMRLELVRYQTVEGLVIMVMFGVL